LRGGRVASDEAGAKEEARDDVLGGVQRQVIADLVHTSTIEEEGTTPRDDVSVQYCTGELGRRWEV